MAGQLHGDPLRDASTDHVPDGGAPQVVRKASRGARRATCRPPCLRETHDRLRLGLTCLLSDQTEEDARGDDALLPEEVALLLSTFEQCPQLGRHREYPSLVVLGGTSVQRDLAGLAVIVVTATMSTQPASVPAFTTPPGLPFLPRDADALLVVPPFIAPFTPSPGIELLAACARRSEFRSSTVHANLSMTSTVGESLEQGDRLAGLGQLVEQWRAQWSRSGIERPEFSIRPLVTGQKGEPIGPFVLTDTRGLPGTDRLTLLTREEADVAFTDAVRNAPELISWALARKVGVMIDGCCGREGRPPREEARRWADLMRRTLVLTSWPVRAVAFRPFENPRVAVSLVERRRRSGPS